MTNNEQWHLTANAAHLYDRYVARYILSPWVPSLLDAGELAAGERVLDVACGTGVVTRAAAERVGACGHVVGVDLNPEMIEVAKSLPAPTGAPIEWVARSALNLGMEDARFDAVLCQQGLQFFPDKVVALREMRRVLKCDGRLALSVWNNAGHYNSAVGRALAEFVSNEVSARFCASRQTPSAEELQRLATAAGFAAVKVRISRVTLHLYQLDRFTLDHLAATPVAPAIAAADPEARKKLGRSVSEQLRRYADGDGVTYPEETHVMTAKAL